ncbi:type IV pilus modification PilV family protein [Demequina lutea]|uniref:Prepilin-type N-terminal cleavage/methylation domain-containing protein n=1 Tax=Demequina lutea TaxID=431489 RepID=A0A7Z0CK08_9MICO|nr:type II secretion system protein [Demequina lutea]NYI41357.1 prepilin-type N-terminal cleavage/methylation domain-containing protein [Demequina lutea]
MRAQRRHHDDGFSLVEVIVAIVILGIVATSALYFFINGMQTTSNLSRQQRAVAIATSAMEHTFTIDPHLSPIAGVSGLVIGRSAAEVNDAFSKFAGVDGVADTYPLSDPHGATGAGDVKVFDTVSAANNTTYDVYTLIGSCYRSPAVAGAAQPCTKVGGYSTEPAAGGVGVSRELRIIVVVRWKPIGGECDATGGICSYNVSTLVDPSNDLAWSRVSRPVAVDDPDYAYDPVAGNPTYSLHVMDNDILGSVRSIPVQKVPGSELDSTAGSVTYPSDGVLVYTPPPATPGGSALGGWVSGIFTFKYAVFDRTGASSSATVTITLHPKAVADPALSASQGIPKVLPVLANDLGSPTAVQITGGPYLPGAKISVSGTTVTYTPGDPGTDTFTYKFTDAAGQSSQAVTATVKVDPLTAQDFTMVLPYSTTATWTDISSQLRGTNPAETQITVTGLPSPGTGSLLIDGNPYTGGTATGTIIKFQPPAGKAGEWTFPFKVVLGARTSDNTANAVIRVEAPASVFQANPDDQPYGLSISDRYVKTIEISSNDLPDWSKVSGYTVTAGSIKSNCGRWYQVEPYWSNYLAKGYALLYLDSADTTSGTKNCTASYTVTRKSDGATSTTQITYDVAKSYGWGG